MPPSLKFAAAILLLVSLCAAPAFAESKPFRIEAQSAARALTEFAKQANRQILFKSERVKGITTNAIAGDYEPEAAIALLLKDTGLQAWTREGDVLVVDLQAPGKSGSPTKTSTEKTAEAPRMTLADAAQVQGDAASNARSAAAQDASGVEEIVVTAQKRRERLIEVPQSVTVVSADDIARLGATQFRDYANTIPGLSFTTRGAGNIEISIRGVSTFGVSKTVSTYIDEVPYGSSTTFAFSSELALDVGLFDVDRIEVLRGPQGTLYGASSMGGLLKYVTKRPDSTRFGGDVQTGVSTTEDGGIGYNLSAALNLPLMADKAALRVSGFESHDGGYFDNVGLGRKDVDRSDVYGGRLDFLATPTDALSVRIAAFAQNISRDGYAAADFGFNGEPLHGALVQQRILPEPFDQRFRLISATVAYDFGAASLTSVSSYQTVRSALSFDLSPLYMPFLNDVLQLGPYSAVGFPTAYTTDKFTQEVRLASASRGRAEWIVGGFCTQETSKGQEDLALFDLAGVRVPNDAVYTSTYPSRLEEYAVFGDLTWHFTDKLDATGGVRYADNRQKFHQDQSGIFGGSKPQVRSDESVVTYLFNTRYRMTERATAYVRYATGYRPGGPNFAPQDPITGQPLAPLSFESDRLESYEIGFRGETDARRFSVDVSAYTIVWSNIQIGAARNNVFVRTNAEGGARIRGAELTLTARPTRGFTTTGAFAFQDATLSQTDFDIGGKKGDRLTNVPRVTAALSADYAFVGARLDPTIGATVRHIGDRRSSFDNPPAPPQYRLPEYTMVDLRAGLTFGKVNAQLYVHNLFDERSQLSAFTSYGLAYVAMGQPRTIGIVGTTDF